MPDDVYYGKDLTDKFSSYLNYQMASCLVLPSKRNAKNDYIISQIYQYRAYCLVLPPIGRSMIKTLVAH